LIVESNSHLRLFCITTLSDWLKNLAPLYQPIRSTPKTNHDMLAHVFPHFVMSTCIALSFDWFTGLFVSLVIGQSDYFDFGFRTLNPL